ncbi:hypothetical protein Tco_0897854 [Tanacetum coccineum]
MSAMLSSDATFSMEMFPFGHCLEGNGDVSSIDNAHENNHTTGIRLSLKGGSGNSGGKILAISMVEEAWLSEKEDV